MLLQPYVSDWLRAGAGICCFTQFVTKCSETCGLLGVSVEVVDKDDRVSIEVGAERQLQSIQALTFHESDTHPLLGQGWPKSAYMLYNVVGSSTKGKAPSRSLLAVFAHPDDEPYGLSGTLVEYSAEGLSLSLLLSRRKAARQIYSGQPVKWLPVLEEEFFD